jgi:hypothetical protein
VQDWINRFQQWKKEQNNTKEDLKDKKVRDNNSIKKDREEKNKKKDKDKGFKDRLFNKEI